MTVSFTDAVNGCKGRQPSKVWVHFAFINDIGERVKQKNIRLSILYKDWYNECEHCPPNDTLITAISIRTEDGAKFAIGDTKIEFGDFMDTLEENFKFRNPNSDL